MWFFYLYIKLLNFFGRLSVWQIVGVFFLCFVFLISVVILFMWYKPFQKEEKREEEKKI